MESNSREPRKADNSIPELLAKLAAETSTLVRQELALAQAELTQKVRRASGSAVPLGAAALLALGAFGALTTTLIAALALLVPPWAAALIVTVVYAVVAAVMAQRGVAALKKVGAPVPTRTIKTLQEDVDAVRAGVRRGR